MSLVALQYALVHRAKMAQGLPREQESVPILGVRAARYDLDSRTFQSVTMSGTFGVETTATCMNLERVRVASLGSCDRRRYQYFRELHGRTPNPGCSCGFYAVPPDQEIPYRSPTYVKLLVELAGQVIVHEIGMRGEWQRVLEMRVPSCVSCGAAVDRAGYLYPNLRGGTRHMPVFFHRECLLGRQTMYGQVPIERVLKGAPVPVVLETGTPPPDPDVAF